MARSARGVWFCLPLFSCLLVGCSEPPAPLVERGPTASALASENESGVELATAPQSSNDARSDTSGAAPDTCPFGAIDFGLSPRIDTVGAVEWEWMGPPLTAARLVFTLMDAAPTELNRGGVAPVATHEVQRFRTLLLGLKQHRRYEFYIEAEVEARTCRSARYPFETGTLTVQPRVEATVVAPKLRDPGFLVTSSGTSLPNAAFIIDADGEVVWSFEGPTSTTRALLDYAGEHVWMLSLNLLNDGGEMRSVTLDGMTEQRNVPGMETAHHDFTVLPNGSIAALAWTEPGIDTESRLLIRAPDGSVSSPFTIGANLYASDGFHANALHYVPYSDSYTIADRNPSVVVNVDSAGVLDWQLGGDCAIAPAGARCFPVTWEVIHGHHLLPDGRLLVFNNTYSETARVLEFRVEATSHSFGAELLREYVGTNSSSTLGDVQRLASGNTLITYSSSGKIVEVDPQWNVVQTFDVRVGYVNWRPSLYGPPVHL